MTHLGNGIFLCGVPDAEIEAKEKVNKEQLFGRCNRVFTVVHPVTALHDNVSYRKLIGKLVNELRSYSSEDRATVS